MTRAHRRLGATTAVFGLSACLFGAPVRTWAQTPPPAGTSQSQQQGQSQAQTPPPQNPPLPPVTAESLERIRKAVDRPPSLRVEDGQLRIYVEVIGKWPSWVELAKGYDLKYGPTYGGPTHQEFLNMVTPKDMYSSVGIQPLELLTSALVTYFGKKIITKGLKELSEARDEREIRAIRERIDRELAALKGGK
jgi:hypothetical protein